MARKATTETLFHAMHNISLIAHNALCVYSSAGTETLARHMLIRGFDRILPFIREAGFIVTDPLELGNAQPSTAETEKQKGEQKCSQE